MKNQPITSKIKRDTKGGMVTQPVLNMGAPVKMKAHSPAKSTPPSMRNISFKEYRESGSMPKSEAKFYQGKGTKRVNAADFPEKKTAPKTKKAPEYTNMTFLEYKKSGLMNPKDALKYSGSGTKRVKTSLLSDKKTTKAPASGYTPPPKPWEQSKNPNPSTPTSSGNSNTKTKKISYDKAYEATRNHKVYGKMSKAEYIKEAKRQNASKKAGKGWGVKNKAASTRKKVNTPDVKTVGTKKLTISTKLEPKVIKVDAKKESKVQKAIDRKLGKADKARAAGNENKALRKERAAEKKKKRISKRTGSSYSQGANAINPS